MARLNKRQIEATKYDGTGNARHVLWDDNPRGLGLRVFPSGRKSFVLSYRVHGRKRLMSLGDLGVLTLDTARSRAKVELVKLEGEHAIDPLTEKRKRVIEAKTGTVAQMVAAYIDQAKAKTAVEMRRQTIKDITPTFGARNWRDVKRSEVRAWHAGIKAPYSANRALALLRSAFYWRLAQEDDSAGHRGARTVRDLSNPCAGIEVNRERPRQVRLERDELPKLEKAIDVEADPYVKGSFRFMLAVGCRRSEALALKWSDVVNSTATFHDTKNGDMRAVPVPKYAAQVLKSLPRVAGNVHVFVGRKPGAPLANVSKAWRRIRKRAGIEHIRLHDLRRTFGSWLGDAGFSSKQIGSVLGHRSDVTSRVYMALGDQSKRAAVTAMNRMMKPKTPRKPKRGTNVIPFPKRATR